MDIPCGIFCHIIIIKEAAPMGLKSLKHSCWLVLKVNTKSLVIACFVISGSSAFNALEQAKP